MTSIKTTLDSALPVGAQGAYPNEYTSVLEALVNRDYALTDQITDVVHMEFGTDKDTVRTQLELAGMAVRPKPAPVVVAPAEPVADEAPAPKAKKSKKDKTAKLVRKLVKAARSHGISI